MLIVRDRVIYLSCRLPSGYWVMRVPPNDDAELIASKLNTKDDVYKVIEEDIKCYNNAN